MYDYAEMRTIALSKAHELYGNPLPKEIQERLDLELHSIISNGFDIVYRLAMKLADKSREYGYLIGNRGCIGSSFVAYLLGITNCNPVPQKYSGFNIPFEIFAGVDFNETLNITLNVAQDIHKNICEYLDELLKEEGIYKDSNGYCAYFKRSIETKEGKSLAKMTIVTHSVLMPLKELHKATNALPPRVLLNENKEDVTEIFDLLIKEQFYGPAGLEDILDIISKIEINTVEKLAMVEGVLFGTGMKEAREVLIESITSGLTPIISSRDDIMVYLMQNEIDRKQAYYIMENVSKGKGLTKEMEEAMLKHNIPTWYIELCNKIDYLSSKAHNVERAIMDYRLAWYGVHYPKEYAKVMEKWRD